MAVAPYGASSQSSALQADNKVVMVGTNLQMAPPPPPPAPPTHAQLEDEDFFAVRLDANGAVDPSFGSNGIIRTPIDLDPGARDVARGVAVGPDGSIVVVGDAWRANFDSDVAFVRYTPAGELDSSFSGNGIQTVDLGPQDIGYAAVVQPDGKIVGAATTSTYHGFEVVRLNADGSPDQSFGSGGVVRTPIGNPSLGDESLAVALDATRIVVGGDTDSGTGAGDFAVARYLSDGQLDASFGSGGIVVTPGAEDDLIRAVAVMSGGKILVAGYGGSGSTTLRLRLARYLGDGSLDTTFGGTGVVTTAIGNYAGAVSLAIQPDGKAVAGGWSNGGPSFALARYNDDGSQDPSFGEGGVRTYPVGTHGGDGTSVLLQHLPDGRAPARPDRHGVGGRRGAVRSDRPASRRSCRPAASSSTRSAASRSASCPSSAAETALPRPAGDRTAARPRACADPGASMFGRPRAASTFAAGSRHRAASEPEGRSSQAAEGPRLAGRQPGPTAVAAALFSSRPTGNVIAVMLRLG